MDISNTNAWKATVCEELGSDNQFSVWLLTDEIKIESEYYYDPIEVQLTANSDDAKNVDIHSFDLKRAEEILKKVDFYIEKSIAYIKSELLSKPELFGIEISDAEKYKETATEDFPVELPFIYFYSNGSWVLEFKYANDFPAVEPGLGIEVIYNSHNEIEKLSIPDINGL